MNQWTKEQQRAITAPPSLLVSAAAGAGKTAVLTERIARLVEEGADVRSLLVVTFTEAAAREMKQRVEERLSAAAQAAREPEKAARLRAQAQAVGRGGSNISTLHAFCLYLLRRNFHALGLDPAFSTADEAQAGMLFQEALEEVASQRCEAGDPGYLSLLHALRREEALFAYAKKLHTFLMAQPQPWEWLAKARDAYCIDAQTLQSHPAVQELLQSWQREVLGCVHQLQTARGWIPLEYQNALGVLDDDLSQLRALSLSKTYAAYAAAVEAVTFRRFVGWPRGVEEQENKQRVMDARDGVKKKIRAQQAAAARPLGEETALLGELSGSVEALCSFVQDVDGVYAGKKRERGLVDFGDMEHMALAVLQKEEAAQGLRARYAHIFVDEYQDSSLIQEAILNRIRKQEGRSNLFLVGDVKQSIYRFRLAEPGLFLDKMQRYTGAPGAPGEQVHLNINFRSAPAVLRGVNSLFSRIMTEEVGELCYDETAALYPAPSAVDTPLSGCELHLIEREYAPEEEEDGQKEELFDAQAEARLAAGYIRRLMEEETYIDPKQANRSRKLRYRDFVVLLRAHRQAAQLWAAELARQGIPAYAQLTGGYFEAVEVQVFLNLLRVIDNRRQDIPLISVLRAIGGFTVEDLIGLRTQVEPKPETCFESLVLLRYQDTDLGRKAAAFLARLETYRREAGLLPLEEFLAYLLEDTGYYACVGVLPGGAQRQANLDALLAKARQLKGRADLYGFLQFMSRAADTADLGRAQVGAADVVRILSMHGSKGLEYPVVILGGLGKGFNRKNSREDLLLDSALGLGLRCAQERTRIRRDPVFRRAILQKQWRQQLAEEMRILYVGMTRARERLILLGCAKEARERIEQAQQQNIVLPAVAGAAGSFLDWLLPLSAQQPEILPLCYHTREEAMACGEQAHALAQQGEEAGFYALLQQRFAWRYPYEAAIQVPSKVSVSALERLGEQQIQLCDAPQFQQETAGLSAAAKGTATHLFLSLLPLCWPQGELMGWLAGQRDGFVAQKRMAKSQAQAVDLGAVARFLNSPLGKRLGQASRVEREMEFSVFSAADDLLGENTTEPVLLQGVIDCCFVEQGSWILLDYKTDYVAPGADLRQAAQAHAGQVALYAQALEALTHVPVARRYIVFLRGGEAVEV